MSEYVWTGYGSGFSQFEPEVGVWQRYGMVDLGAMKYWTLKRSMAHLRVEIVNRVEGTSVEPLPLFMFGLYQYHDRTQLPEDRPGLENHSANWLWWGQVPLRWSYNDFHESVQDHHYIGYLSMDSSAQRKIEVDHAGYYFIFGLSSGWPSQNVQWMQGEFMLRCLYHF